MNGGDPINVGEFKVLFPDAEKMKTEESARLGALTSAEWLAPKAKMEAVKAPWTPGRIPVWEEE